MMKHCRKMKRKQRACLGSMRRKRDMVRRRDDVDRRRDGSEEGKERRRCQLCDSNFIGLKNKENSCGRFD
jgi:hypothetical protein